MRYGRKNLVFGFVYLIFTLGLGLAISVKMQADPSFAKEGFGFPRVIMRAAHAHGNLEAILSILVGLIVDRLNVSDSLKRTMSFLVIFGALLHSGVLYVLPLMPFIGKLAVVGAASLIATMALMAYSVSKGVRGQE